MQDEQASPIEYRLSFERDLFFEPIRDDPVFIDYLQNSQRLAEEQRDDSEER